MGIPLAGRYPISWRMGLGVQGLRSLKVLRSGPHQSGTYDLKLQA